MAMHGIKLPSSCDWVCRVRNYSQQEKKSLHWEEVSDHPLKPIVVTVTDSRVARKVFGGSAGSSTGSSTPTAGIAAFQSRSSSISALGPTDPLSSALEGSDPLSQFAKEQESKDAELDPLSKMAAEYASDDLKWDSVAETRSGKQSHRGGVPLMQQASSPMHFPSVMDKSEPWAAKKAAILNRFTTSEKLSIVTSFLSSGGASSGVGSPSSVPPSSSHAIGSGSMGDKVRNRLEQLDELEEGVAREVHGGLSQGEYMARIAQLGRELQLAWSQDQRVRALKIAIQCSKLLVDTSGINFYPSKFVLITDILDGFGSLVYDRLRSKAGTSGDGFAQTGGGCHLTALTPDLVPEMAKETCKNWFYKIASIRELVPRLYVEMAILKSYAFLTSSEFSEALLRLTRMIRGIGDPLVAAYARCYLCRVGPQLMQVHPPAILGPDTHAYLRENFYDFIGSYNQLFSRGVKGQLESQRVEVGTYLTLYSPSLEWILQGVANDASCRGGDAEEKALNNALERCKDIQNSGLILNSIMSTFKPALISNKSLLFIQLISACDDNGFPQHLLMRTLGWCLSHDSSGAYLEYNDGMEPREYHLKVLNAAWRLIGKLQVPSEYLGCALAWIHYPLRCLSAAEVNTLLGDVIKHVGVPPAVPSSVNFTSVQPSASLDSLQPQLLAFLQALLADATDLEALFTLDRFLPFVDLFKRDSVRLEAYKAVMEAFCRSGPCDVSDPVLISTLMFLCRALHDSVNALTIEDDRRHISRLICSVISRVESGAGGDFEARLSFLVDARASFPNLDPVHAHLVQAVNRLSVTSRKVVRGHHTRKTAAFVRACSAYAHITVPSLPSATVRLSLFLLSGQVALLNQCLGQADACFKAALSLIPEVPPYMESVGEGTGGKQRSSEPFLVGYLSQFLSTLLVVPDPPEQGVLYLTRGLLNVVQHYSWLGSPGAGANSSDTKRGSMSQAMVYLNVLQMLSSATQETYLYRVDKVDSNDVLYGGDPKFVQEVERMCSRVLVEVLSHLHYLGETHQWKELAHLSFELFHRVTLFGDVGDPAMLSLALSLWHLAHSRSSFAPDQKLSARTLDYLKRRAGRKQSQQNGFSALLEKLLPESS
ncbi:VPS35 endosomal protein-sorting factor-like isoform X2 [Ischnura elegans]|uniref:VPS35 endosomal protein-sorting factor-like isoform X2 n=1 Tax=Ischnura elegans TaxID=197161 RepID=UPI001ED88041|nr:VPS35 endosomal protein-sorting factor-like isoform X2 [Ischnura elegans]